MNEFLFKFRSVLEICLNTNVSGAGFKALSKVIHLQELLFGKHMKNWELEQKCVVWSVKFMPRLHVVGRRYDVSDFDSYITHIMDTCSLTTTA